jgi:hypothetical protein
VEALVLRIFKASTQHLYRAGSNRMMRLDAVLASPALVWLATAGGKAGASLVADEHSGGSIAARHCRKPHVGHRSLVSTPGPDRH